MSCIVWHDDKQVVSVEKMKIYRRGVECRQERVD